MAEIRERHDGAPADAQHVLEHHARLPRRLQRLRQDHVVEGVVGIIGEVGVGVALDHRQTLGDAFVDAFARQLDAAAVDAARLAEKPQQLAVAAADVEHLRARLDHLRDDEQVDARVAMRARGVGHGKIARQPVQHGVLPPLPACGERVASSEAASRVRGTRRRAIPPTPPHPVAFASLRRPTSPRTRGEV